MKRFKEILNEELTPEQKKRVDSWEQGDTSFSDHIFGGKHNTRISIPLEDHGELEPNPKVSKHLEKHGYSISSYRKGLAKAANGREIGIGKVLHRTGADDSVKKEYEQDPSRMATRKHSNLHVIVSRHPHDVAGMSTDRGWSSCLNMNPHSFTTSDGKEIHLEQGGQVHTLEHDVKHGTHVAYLCHKEDTNIDKPLARIALKAFHSEDREHKVLHPDPDMYGSGGNAFADTVRHFTEKHFPMKTKKLYKPSDGVYTDHGKLYSLHSNDSQTLEHFANSPYPEHQHAVIQHKDYDKHLDTLLKNPDLHSKNLKLAINKMSNSRLNSTINKTNSNSKLDLLGALMERSPNNEDLHSHILNNQNDESHKDEHLSAISYAMGRLARNNPKLYKQMKRHSDSRIRRGLYSSLSPNQLEKELNSSTGNPDPHLISSIADSMHPSSDSLYKTLLDKHSNHMTDEDMENLIAGHQFNKELMRHPAIFRYKQRNS